jgi:hypothetical protein
MKKLQLYSLLILGAMLGMGMGFPNLVEEASPDETFFSCQRQQACGKSPADQPAAPPLPDPCRASGTSAGSARKHLFAKEVASLSLNHNTNQLVHD